MNDIKLKKETWFKKYIKTIDKTLYSIIILALGFSLSYKLILINWEAPCQFIYQLGDWTFLLSMSILAAGIFHFFTVHYKLINDRQKYAPIVYRSIYNLYKTANKNILENIAKHYKGFEYDNIIPNKEEWNKRVLCEIDEDAVNWKDAAYGIANTTKTEFEIISNYKNEYPEIFEIVSDLYSTNLVRSVDAVKFGIEENKRINFANLEPYLFEYIQTVSPLHPYFLKIIAISINNSNYYS